MVCTGAEPAVPPIPGLRETPHLTYSTIFDLDRLPKRLLVLGGGPVGAELAQAFQRLGSSVTIVEKLDRLLPAAGAEASAVVEERFRREGVELVLASEVEGVEGGGSGEVAVVAAGTRRAGDALLVAAGRRPRAGGLGLEEIGVAVTPRGIEVDADLRTSLRHVYAAGDVAGGPQFTHYAVWQGYAAARSALFPGRVRGVRTSVPWAVFTDPEVAQVGISAEDARAHGRRVEVHRLPVDRIDRAQTDADTDGFLELITADGDRLLGATIVSAGAAVGLSRLARGIHVYPTRGYGLLQLASSVRLEQAASSRLVRLVRRLTWGRPERARPSIR